MNSISILIVDDEPLARRGIRQLIEDDPQIKIIGEYGTAQDALASIHERKPDLLFLDVQMPRMNGFELLAQIPKDRLPAVIFVTAHDRYAIDAFEAEALDYLLKPFTEERFHKALRRAKLQINRQATGKHQQQLASLLARYGQSQPAREAVADVAYLKKLMVKSGGNIHFLPMDEIDWIEAADYYALLHVGGRSYSLRESLSELEAKLDPAKFARIHRSAIVNVERIRQLQPQQTGDYQVILLDGTKIRMSRRRREKLSNILQRLS